MKSQPEAEEGWGGGDAFLDNSILSQINRRFSRILHGVLPLPETWREEPSGSLRWLLSRLNSLSMLLLLLVGIAMSISLIVIAFGEDSLSLFLYGLMIIPGVFLVQFVTGLFCSANLNLTFGRTIVLSSRIVPETLTIMGVGYLFYTIAVWVLLVGNAFKLSVVAGVVTGVIAVLSIVAAFFQPWLAANSDLLNVEVRDSSDQGAADYFFQLIQYLGRYVIASVPLQFAYAMFLLGLAAVYSLFLSIRNGDSLVDILSGLGGFFPSGGGLALLSQITATGIVGLFLLPVMIPVLAHFLALLILAISDLGSAFFRLVDSSSRVAELSEVAMGEGDSEEKRN